MTYDFFKALYTFCCECHRLLLSQGCSTVACHACKDLVQGVDREGWFWWNDDVPIGPYATERDAWKGAEPAEVAR